MDLSYQRKITNFQCQIFNGGGGEVPAGGRGRLGCLVGSRRRLRAAGLHPNPLRPRQPRRVRAAPTCRRPAARPPSASHARRNLAQARLGARPGVARLARTPPRRRMRAGRLAPWTMRKRKGGAELIHILRQQISSKTIAMNGDASDRSDDTALMHLPNPFNDTMSTRDEQGTFLGQVIREVSARNGFRARSVQSRSSPVPVRGRNITQSLGHNRFGLAGTRTRRETRRVGA